MKVMFFHQREDHEAEINDMIDTAASDPETTVFKNLEISNIDNEPDAEFTIYTADGYFYFTLGAEDTEMILKALLENRSVTKGE